MDLRGWNERYRSGERPAEDIEAAPTPLVIETAKKLTPGKALDLACGAGRNALWLAEHGWSVTAVDGAQAAIEIVRRRASERSVTVDARVANLENNEYQIEPSAWDLIVMSYYLQRDLFEPAKRGLKPGGTLIAIVHTTEPGEEPNYKRLRPGELKVFFQDLEILHHYEGKPNDAAHHRGVAEVVARRPRLPSDSLNHD
ncbi:MAG TPA: class I SAM-dependent methyltransferase [Bryobacteraceae bacterium]|nr:class I SAM-dependent methyltransferase [Bryobacteraceae bacterium]